VEPTEHTFGGDDTPPQGEPMRGPPVTNWSELADQVQGEIRHQADVRPYVTVIAAASIGYVLGAGIPRWAWRYAFDAGSKLLMARVVAAVVGDED
jgi:hypothetical protein